MNGLSFDYGNMLAPRCEGGVDPMTREQAETLIGQVENWQLSEDGKMISRRFEFKGFYKTVAFINAMAWVANSENHHPDFSAAYVQEQYR